MPLQTAVHCDSKLAHSRCGDDGTATWRNGWRLRPCSLGLLGIYERYQCCFVVIYLQHVGQHPGPDFSQTFLLLLLYALAIGVWCRIKVFIDLNVICILVVIKTGRVDVRCSPVVRLHDEDAWPENGTLQESTAQRMRVRSAVAHLDGEVAPSQIYRTGTTPVLSPLRRTWPVGEWWTWYGLRYQVRSPGLSWRASWHGCCPGQRGCRSAPASMLSLWSDVPCKPTGTSRQGYAARRGCRAAPLSGALAVLPRYGRFDPGHLHIGHYYIGYDLTNIWNAVTTLHKEQF